MPRSIKSSIPRQRRLAHAARLNLRAATLTASALDDLERRLDSAAVGETARRTAVNILQFAGHSTDSRPAHTLFDITTALADLHLRHPLTKSQRDSIRELLPAYDRSPRHLLLALRREVLSPIQRITLTRFLKAKAAQNPITPCQSSAPYPPFPNASAPQSAEITTSAHPPKPSPKPV